MKNAFGENASCFEISSHQGDANYFSGRESDIEIVDFSTLFSEEMLRSLVLRAARHPDDRVETGRAAAVSTTVSLRKTAGMTRSSDFFESRRVSAGKAGSLPLSSGADRCREDPRMLPSAPDFRLKSSLSSSSDLKAERSALIGSGAGARAERVAVLSMIIG